MSSMELVQNTIEEIFGFLGINPEVSVREDDDTLKVDIEGDNLNFLIGYRGESLDGLQTIMSIILFNKLDTWPRILVDINGYRKAKLEKIESITRSYVDKVRFLNKEIVMPPMNPFERRHVHIFISGYDDIVSESFGEEPYRKVVLKPVDMEVR